MLEYGDLSGIVFNSETGNLVGGHQRKAVFDQRSEIVIEKRYPKPTRTGTVARGYLLFNKERFSYREVRWDSKKELAANLAANKNAGDWDKSGLTSILKELKTDLPDIELTGFGTEELSKLKLDDIEEDEPEKTPQKKFVFIKCPKCKHVFEEGRAKVVEKR